MKLAVVGAGWAGLSAAVHATRLGHTVTVFEASRTLGGRARAVPSHLPDGTPVMLDNGQHLLIGAYTQTLDLMQQVGLDPALHLLRLPLTLQYPDGSGLVLPDWPSPLDAMYGILRNRGWTWHDKWTLLRTVTAWRMRNFRCASDMSVQDLCAGISQRVVDPLLEPLCISALNTPASRASGQVFLRVLQDALFGVRQGSRLLLPTTDLGKLFPEAAATWLEEHGARLQTGHRVERLQRTNDARWWVNQEAFDAVLLACPAPGAASLVRQHVAHDQPANTPALLQWAETALALRCEGIATVYAHAPGVRLPKPMLALPGGAAGPAQFVFDRGQLGGPGGLLAFVVSASTGDRLTLQTGVLRQAAQHLAQWLGTTPLAAVQTIVEKRATFSCTPGLQRPAMDIAPGLMACGDWVQGPYPATLEGATRSGVQASHAIFCKSAGCD